MNCQEVQQHLLDYQRGTLRSELRADIGDHLVGCPACTREEAAEQALTDVLEARLPQHSAPLGLKRALAASWPAGPAPRPSAWARWGRPLVPAAAVAVLLLTVMPLYYQRPAAPTAGGLVAEAVNDHLRILTSQHPLDIESSNFHQVKPWFEGRLDFAPVVPFLGDAEFPLKGGAVGYFLDRKAAVFIYQRRLHAVSLFVCRADGLSWPGGDRASVTPSRGFTVMMWRAGGLGYALVSDVDAAELAQLGTKLGAGS